MFTKFPNELFALLKSDEKDLGSRILIMLRILHRCGFDGEGVCFESRKTISEAIGVSTKTVTRIMTKLENDEFIHVSRNPMTPNHVTLTEKMKKIIGGHLDPLKRDNNILYRGSYCPSIEQQEEKMENESAKRPRKKRPKKNTKTKKITTPVYLSEIDKIHQNYLKKKKKEDSGS